MNRCCLCNDPAVRAVTVGKNPGSPGNKHYYCYLPHAEAGFSDPQPADLQALASRLGYAVNAIVFLADAMQNNVKLCRNAMGCCIATRTSAERYFGSEAGQALRIWGIGSGNDIAAIVFGLIEARILSYREDETPEQFKGIYTVGEIP